MRKRYRWNYKKCLRNLLLGLGYLVFGGAMSFALLLSIVAPIWN